MWGSAGCFGQLCSQGEEHCPTRELGQEARLMCPAPSWWGGDLTLSLPLIPAGMELFNTLHLYPPTGGSWWDSIGLALLVGAG